MIRSKPQGALTMVLGRAQAGDERAREEVIALVYDDLRNIAGHQLRREYQARTLEPTALVHEAYLKMLSGGNAAIDASDRAHFLAMWLKHS